MLQSGPSRTGHTSREPAASKKRGTTDPGDAVVLMTLRDLTSLLLGYRPPEVDA